MDFYCALGETCGKENPEKASTIIEGWALCRGCLAYVLARGFFYPDGRLVIFRNVSNSN